MLTPNARRSTESAPYWKFEHFPLSSAYLCSDCNSIGNSANQCPACASEVLMSLAVVLNRDIEPIAAEFTAIPALTVATTIKGPALAA